MNHRQRKDGKTDRQDRDRLGLARTFKTLKANLGTHLLQQGHAP